MGATAAECEFLVRQLEKQDYGDFDVAFDVIFNVVLDQFCISVMATDRVQPGSTKKPVFKLPVDWVVYPHWDWAEAAGAHVGVIFKEK